jgi:transketolase
MRAFAHSTDSRGNPAITVLTPSDAVSAYALILAMAHFPSACYLRAVRADLPVLYDAKTEFPFRGHKVLLDGGSSNQRVALVACGYMVHSCLKAAEELANRGIGVAVVDAYALPMDTAPVLCRQALRARSSRSKTATSAASQASLQRRLRRVRTHPRIRSLTVHRMPKSGRTPDDVRGYVDLSIPDLVAAVTATAR